MPADGIPRGVQYGQVPRWVLEDGTLSCRARCLYALFCSFAKRKTNQFYCSLEKIATREGVTAKTIQDAVRELEERGLVEKLRRIRLIYTYEVTRDPDRAPEVKSRNAPRLAKRRRQFGEYGRKGAATRAARAERAGLRATKLSPKGEKDFVPNEKDPSARTDTPKQILTNRARGTSRKQREEPLDDIPKASKVSGQPTDGVDPHPSQLLDNPSSHASEKSYGDIDWNGWIKWLSGCQTRKEATLWIFGALDRIKGTLNLSSEDAHGMLDRVLRKARATGLRPKPGDLNRLLEQSIGKVSE